MISRSFWGYITELISDENSAVAIAIFSLIAVNVCTLGIHFWWRHHTRVLYHQRLQTNILKEHQAEIEEKDRQINKLSECNDLLSKTVHRDNKLIPAMYTAVSSFLTHAGADSEVEIKRQGIRILSELDEMIQERKEMISGIHSQHKELL
jgi:hypothetical protein